MMNGGGMGTLSPALSGRLQSAIAGGLFPATALDPKILGDLGALPEHMASVVLDRFLSSNMANVRNPSAFLVGVMNRYKSEVQAGGVPIPPAPPQLLGLAAGGDAAAALQSQVAPDAAAAAAAGLAAAGFAPASVLGAPAMGFGARRAALMGAQSVTSTGVPQNTNPLLAPSKTIHVGNLNAAVTPDVLRQIFVHRLPRRAPPVTAEADPNFAFLNPAQQRAALEAKHREKLTGAKNISGWGVAKRRDSDSDDDSRDRRRRRGRDRDRGRSDRRRRRDRGDSRKSRPSAPGAPAAEPAPGDAEHGVALKSRQAP
ncbi:hypothetical protein JL720_10042 [Aureococcus anophagefferens]|nr:hypothetical protein JL720_10042 [Aureococcus anophagefferens]